MIFLGNQLCKEIANYADNLQCYDKDIQSIRLKAESLKTPLKRLRDLIEDSRLSDPEIANDIHEKVLGLELQVKRPEKKPDTISPAFSGKTADRFHNKLKRLCIRLSREMLFGAFRVICIVCDRQHK